MNLGRRHRLALAGRAAIALLACAACAPACGTSLPVAHWVSTWSAPPVSAGPRLPALTLRQIVRLSLGGNSLRVRISNRYGTAPLAIGAAHVAARATGSAIKESTDQTLLFDGKASTTLAPGAEMLSDALAWPTQPLQELAISLYLPQGASVSTLHDLGRQTAFLTAGDAAAAGEFAATQTVGARFFVTDVEVDTASSARALVVIGDSIVDGFSSTPDRNARWPDALAARLQRETAFAHIGVINAGISGNRLLHDGPAGSSVLTRLERDALDKPGARWVLLHIGINDIGMADEPETPTDDVSAQQIIDGMRTVIARARTKGVAIWGATLLPCAGSGLCRTDAAEAKRQAVNAWIRDAHAFDAVVDFDKVMRDPAQPQRLLPALDSGDRLHPNDAGYAAMAAALDLQLFHAAAPAAPAKKGNP